MCVYMSEVFFLPHLLVFLPPGLITSFHLRYLGHCPVPEECLQDVILGGLCVIEEELVREGTEAGPARAPSS